MRIVKFLSDLKEKEAPATFDGADPMPEDAVIVGTIPENLRILVCEGVQLLIKAREINNAAIKECFGDMLKILDGNQGEEGYEDSEATARRQATLRETDMLTSLSEALGKIFWYELKMSMPEDFPSGTIGISKNWEIYFQKDDGVKRCTTLHGIIIPVK